MAKNGFKITVTTPDQLVYSDEVEMAVIPGEEGEMGVLAHHAPVITTLKSGVVNLHNSGEVSDRIFVSSGFAEVKNNECSILATGAYDLSKITSVEVSEKITQAKAKLNTADNDFDKKIAEEVIELNLEILGYLS